MMNEQQGQQPDWSEQPPWQPQQPYFHPSYYDTQQTQAHPGYYLHSPSRNLSPARRQSGIWQWYKSRTSKMKLAIGCGTILALLLFFSCIGTTVGMVNLAIQATPTPPANQAASTGPIISAQPTPTAISTPTSTPTPQPPLAPAPTPTQPPPTPTPCPGVHCNPWGYNFTPGTLISSPPAAFCSYFACINNFTKGHGYVVECQDSRYSKSGGIQGACAYHGGVLRPLYSH